MAEAANIISSNTNLIGMDAWIGQFLLERTCNRWAEALIPTEDILGTRDASVVYDEIQFSGGSTFGLKGVIKLPNEDFEGDEARHDDEGYETDGLHTGTGGCASEDTHQRGN
jgi:hypothetical protein